MTTTFKPARSGIVAENIQETIDAEDSAKWALLSSQQQYESPKELVAEFARYLPHQNPVTVIDPQCARGNLATYRTDNWPSRYGFELDNRIDYVQNVTLLNTDCQKAFEALDDICDEPLVWDTFNANPPFGKRWSVGGQIVDSTEWTWKRALKHGRQGIFITNHNTAVKLGIDKHPFVVKYERRENVWPNCDVVVGVAVWCNPDAKPTPAYMINTPWNVLRKIIEEEKTNRPPFNVWLAENGKLKTYLSTRSEAKFKLNREQILRLHRIAGSHPIQLVTEVESRRILQEALDCGFYVIEPEAKAAISNALAEVVTLSAPIMPVTDFQRVSYADELEQLKCVASSGMDLTPGKLYALATGTYNFVEMFQREKVHYNEEQNETYTQKHDCTLTGQDRYIEIKDDQGIRRRFMDKPRKGVPNEHPEALLWDIFERPVVRDISDVHGATVERNKQLLRTCEMMAGYQYYQGQIDYLARVLVKDYALIAASTGVGKSLMAITAIACKAPYRALIVAPQGTMKSSGDEEDEEEYQASQWLQELTRFAPYMQIFQLFSMDDYRRIKAMNGGVLPPGVFISYYQALAINGARETLPPEWTDEKLQANYPDLKVPICPESTRAISHSIGDEKHGIRCIVEPSMATLIGHEFDMVLLDEAHYIKGLGSATTQALIRLQPKYRFAFTATPISNNLLDLFPVMGWLCVKDWYLGDNRNASWPYAREDFGRFESTFMSKERDLTQEAERRAADRRWRGKCEKSSPVISSPARLLKILTPTMAFISKESVNPKYVPGKLVDVRVPMGKEQAALYAWFLDRGHIQSRHPLVRARKQIAYLRAICADPAGFEHGGPKVNSNFNPKTIAMLELIAEIRAKREQVAVVCARIGQTNTIARYLQEAGIKYSRIDSTISPDQHAAQSSQFKRGKTEVHLMGIKCAVGHSYDECGYMIVGSLEYSFGSIEQARGRVDRVNSKKPPTIYCVLNKTSLEELMYDVCFTKGDAANICLRGQRVPREFVPVEIGEVLAQSIHKFSEKNTDSELDLEAKWPELMKKLR